MEKGKYKIKVLKKAFDILDLFDERGKELTVTEVHESLDMNKASAFRILKNLEDAGYVEREPLTHKYYLGSKIYNLGLLAEPHTTIKRITRPFLEELNEECQETVHLAVLHQGEALYLDKIEGKKTIRVISSIGSKLPCHCSGVGKVLLADLSEDEVEKIVREKGLPQFTDKTIKDLDRLKAELAKIRQQGYAIDNEEIERGLKCAAALLTNSEGKGLASISISVPSERFNKESDAYISAVRKTAARISRAIHQKGVTEVL